MDLLKYAQQHWLRLFAGWKGKAAHPHSPSGGGGSGRFRSVSFQQLPMQQCTLAHPNSPASRYLPLGGADLFKPAKPAPEKEARLITLAMLKAACKPGMHTDDYLKGLLDAMNTYAEAYEINTPLRIAHFLAQIGHESNFKIVPENGAYSAKRMRTVFGCKGGMSNYDAAKDDCKLGRLRDKLWTEEEKYAFNAKALLSYVYASRYGNGDEASGDGYRYRGRGMIQLTFKDNYRAFTKSHNNRNPEDIRDFVAAPDLVASEVKYAIESAFYFWDSKKLNAKADLDDLTAVTIGVNGGTNGLTDRESRLVRVKKELGLKVT